MKKRVLILCTGNSARSQMAQAIINHERGEVWEAHSGGTHPAPRVNPYAIRALAEIGIITEGQPPTHVDAYRDQPFDLVITVCDDAAENCPLWLGSGKKQHIGFVDPAAATGSDEAILQAFRSVRDAIRERIIAAVDQASL